MRRLPRALCGMPAPCLASLRTCAGGGMAAPPRQAHLPFERRAGGGVKGVRQGGVVGVGRGGEAAAT